MRFSVALMVAASLGWSQAASAAQSVDPAAANEVSAVSGEHRAAAMKLASLLYSDERQLAALDGPAVEQMEAFFRADPSFAAMEADSPGLIDEIMQGLKPLLADFAIAEAPGYRRGAAAVYVRHLSLDELTNAANFYASPLGQKLLDKVGENLSLTSMLREMSANIDAPTSEQAVKNDLDRTAVKAIGDMTAAELADLQMIEQADWFKALESALPELVAFDARFTNEPAPEFEARVGEMVTEILERRFPSSDN